MTRFLYTLAIHALLPWAVLHLLWRARRQKEYLRHWGERFGFYRPRPPEPVIWIHAVSVGETRAAQPLVSALRARYPEHRILITHMTPTGRATSKLLFGDKVARSYLPYDTPWAVKAFLRHFKPALGLIMETELWPNLVAACRDAGVPLLLINARLSEKSAGRYARFPLLARTALRQLSAIAAIGDDDARRLRQLGAPEAAVFGNLKFDIAPPAEQLQTGETFRARLGTRPVLLCASTREGEEALIIEAWKKVSLRETAPAALLVIVPRHPQRFDAVARQVESQDLKLQRRSDNQPVAGTTQVWLGDSMGELFAYYVAARDNGVVFVGGSLLDFGSQNLIEPCIVGAPVLIGPSTFNFADAARDALATGAARQCADADQLVHAALELLADAAARAQMNAASRAFTAQHRGATQRTLALIDRFIPAAR